VQRGPLARAAALRDGLGLTAALLLMAVPGAVALMLVIAGEMAERYIFFRAVDAPKMPGMPSA
jgi:DMSO reductase anchor subunit